MWPAPRPDTDIPPRRCLWSLAFAAVLFLAYPARLGAQALSGASSPAKGALDAHLVLALPAALATGLSTGVGANYSRLATESGTFAYGASASWSTATEYTLIEAVRNDDIRLRLCGLVQRPIGRGVFALRLSAGGTLVYEDRTRAQGNRAGLSGSALEHNDLVDVARRRCRGCRVSSRVGILGHEHKRRSHDPHRQQRRALGLDQRIGGHVATLKARFRFVAVLGISLIGCHKLVGLGGAVTPLVSVKVQVNGDFSQMASPRIALVWGMQWQPEPFCVVEAESPASPAAAAVATAGCPDNFRFVPARDAADVPIQPGSLASLTLVDLPGADVMVGDITSRVAYGSLVVYDDSNSNGTFDLRHPPHNRRRGGPPPQDDGGAAGPPDVVWGASFISMTLPDQRVAFLEGTFNSTVAFYPRSGCPDPPVEFSLLSAGGFSPQSALAVAFDGGIPEEADPSTCATAGLDQTVVLTLQAPSTELQALSCVANDSGGGTSFYVEAPAKALDFYIAGQPNPAGSAHVAACTGFPHLSTDDGGVPPGQQLVIASAPTEDCQYLTHYTLRGCNNDPACAAPNWDITASPPAWWPCQ